MKLLAYDEHDEFVTRTQPGEDARRARLVGADRRFDSGYYQIHRFYEAGAVQPNSVSINYLQTKFQIPDPLIAEYAAEIAVGLRKDGRLYDGPSVMRLHRLELGGVSPFAQVLQASYPDQAGSSFALDYPDARFAQWGGTLRDYYLANYAGCSYATNPLSICLGVCGMLMVTEGDTRYMLTVERSGKLASLEHTVGPSMAGAVDWVTEYRTLQDLIDNAFHGEISEEIGLDRSEYTLTPLAVACEIFRGDRPQLFGLVETKLFRAEIEKRLQTAPGRREYDRFSFHALRGYRMSEDVLERLNFEGRTNCYLAEEYLAMRRKQD